MIIIDFDNTLANTNLLYEYAKNTAINTILLNTNFIISFQTANSLFTLIDTERKNIKCISSTDRYISSLIHLYRVITTEFNLKYNHEVESSILSQSRKIINQIPPLFQETIPFLYSISQSHKLFLWSRGKYKLQYKKIYNQPKPFINFFQKVFITPKKDVNVLSKIISHISPTPQELNNIWVIGDNPQEDIQPAILLNLNHIWINYNNQQPPQNIPISTSSNSLLNVINIINMHNNS